MKNKFKKLLSLSLLILIAITAIKAQTISNDTITKINGSQIVVKITNTNEKDVSFTYPGETMTNTLSKNLIREIIYSSGRKEILNKKIEINGEKDWKKVKLTTVANEVEGLVKKGEFNETTAYLGIYTSQKKDRKSTRLNSSHIPLSRMPSSA